MLAMCAAFDQHCISVCEGGREPEQKAFYINYFYFMSCKMNEEQNAMTNLDANEIILNCMVYFIQHSIRNLFSDFTL